MTKNTRKKAKRQVIPTTLPDDLLVPSTSRNLLPRSRTTSIARSASRSLPSSRGSSRQSSSILAKDASMPQSVLSDSQPRTPSGSGTFPIQTGSNVITAVLPANLSMEEQLSRPASNPANDSHSQDPTQPLPSTSHSMNPLSNVAEPSGSQLPTSRRDATRDILEQNGWPRRFSFDHMESYAPHTDSEDELGVWSANPPGGMRLISNGIQLFTPSIAQNQYTNEGSSHMQSSSSPFNSQPDFSSMAVTDQGVHHFNHNIGDIDWKFPRNVVHDHVATGTEQNYNMTGLRGEQEGDTDPRSTSDMLSSGVWNENRQRHQFDSAPFQYSDDPRSAEFAPFNYWALPSGSSSQVASSSTGVGGSSGKRKRSASPSEDREQEVRIGTSASPPALLTHQSEESQHTKRAELEADEDGEVTKQLLPSDGIEASPSGSRSLQASPITSRKGKGKGKARAEDLEDPQSVIGITTSPFITRQPKSPSPDIRPDLSIGQNTSNSTAGATTSSNPKPSGDPLSSYTCPICFSPPINATLTPCGHICCGECLFAAVKTTLHRSEMSALGGRGLADARCPVCRATIPGWDGKGGGVIGLKVRAVFSL